MKEIKVVAAIIENNGKILCTMRGQGKHDYTSFKWEFPGGKIEQNETEEQALKREIFEELNIKIKIVSHFCNIKYEYPDFLLNMSSYRCLPKSTNITLNVHKNAKWLTIEELQFLDFTPADKPIVEKLLESLK